MSPRIPWKYSCVCCASKWITASRSSSVPYAASAICCESPNMRTRSIGFQLTAWYAAILTAGLGLFGGLIWLSMRARLNAEVDADLKGRANRFEAYFKEESLTARDRHLRNELQEFSQAFPPGSSID